MIYHKRVYNNIVKISVNINMLVRVLPDMLHTWPIFPASVVDISAGNTS